MKKILVKNYAKLQENLVPHMYSPNQETVTANLHLKIKNQWILQEWSMKTIVMNVQKTCIYQKNWGQIKGTNQRTWEL